MKLTKLLVMGALLLVGKGAWAVDGGVWVKPAFPAIPEVSQFTTYEAVTTADEGAEKAVYLYNVATHLFYSGGNNWGTHASIISADNSKDAVPTGECIRGSKVYFLSSSEAVAKGADVVELKTWVYKFNEFRSAFGGNSGVGDCWTDNNGRDDRFWKVTDAGNQTYRISNVKNYTNFFLGWDPNAADTRLSLLDPAAPEVAVDWKLVPADAYDTWYSNVTEDMLKAIQDWQSARLQYNAAMKLKDVLEKAEAAGADVADQIAVYNNTESTEAQLNAAVSAVYAAIERANYNNATAANPATVTNLFIKNPSYDNDKQDGWTWTADGDGKMGMGYSAAEFYQKVFDVNQTLKDLNEGVYAVDVQAFYRAGWGDGSAYTAYTSNDPQSKDVKLYVVNGNDTMKVAITTPYPEAGEKVGIGNEKEVTTADGTKIYIPDNMQAAEAYFVDKNRYHNTLLFGCEGGDTKIGLKNSKSVSGNWVLFDNWSLTYYGKGAAAYQMWSDNAMSSYSTTMGESALYTESYLTALTTATTGKTASTYAEVKANIAAADAAQAALDENVALWGEWKEQLAAAQKAYRDYETALPVDNEEMLDLLMYADSEDEASESNVILAAHNLDNEALVAEIAKVKKLVEGVVEAAKNQVEVGQDMTTFLTNPDFSEGEKGWTGWRTVWQVKWPDKSDPGRQMPKVNEKCAEAFSAPNFDLYQEVEGLPLGIYEVSVQGFFRFGRGNDAWTEWNKQGEERADYVTVDDPAKGSPVFFYVNEKATPFKNIFEEGGRTGDSPLFDDLETAKEEQTPLKRYSDNDAKVEITTWEDASEILAVENCLRVDGNDGYLFFPDGMKSSHNYFNAGAYKQTTFSAVAHKGDKLRIGVKGHSDVGVASDNLDSWAIFDNFKLVYKGKDKAVVKPVLEDAIVVAEAKQKLPIAKDVKEQLASAIAAAEKAIADDADDMFDVLANLWGVDVSASQQKIQELKASLTPFENAINDADAADDDTRPLQSVLDEATSVRATAQNYVDGAKEFTNADIDAIVAKMKELTEALKVPAAMTTASDDNGANATYLIVNPTYDDNKDKKDVAGWTLEGDEPNNYRANSGVYEVWRTKANTLVYQDLEKMPAGTYELSVQGVYRYGWADNDYKAYTEDANNNNYGTLYLKVGEAEAVQKALPRLAALAEYFEAEAETDESGEYVLNDKNEYNYKVTDKWVWAQQTISDDKTMATGYIMPDQLGSTTPFFEDETVKTTSIIFRVGEEGKARIGVNIKHVVDGDWVVWDNWTLKYYGANSAKDPDVVNGVKDASALADVVKTEVFNLSGAQVKNGKGVAIVRQTLSNGTVRVKKVIVK